jgi:precorrin-2/cobalt-factor-2 C20-methyltransferase
VTGRVVGIGVGPGDPELLTLKAVRRLGEADVVVALAAADRPSRARAVVAAHLPENVRELRVPLEMGPDRSSANASYDRLAATVGAELAAGATVAVLCEGDPLLFGTFIYLLHRLPDDAPVEVVPGIPSAIAAAAAERRPLTVGGEGFAVLPATMGTDGLRAALATVASAAILKTGQRFAAVRDLLTEMGLLDDARLIVELGGAHERRLPLADWNEERAPYFSLILTRGLGASHDG